MRSHRLPLERRILHASGAITLIAMVLAFSSACSDPKKRPLGSTCEFSTECASGLCLDGACVDPAGDPDNDGLTNAVEGSLGSDSTLADSDGDMIADPDELGDGLELVDTDGDGRPDIIESAVGDADADCVTDQYDNDDASPTSDVTPMVAAVCPTLGICGVAVSQLRATCPDGAHAECVFSEVVGYANPETACDGRDENCDGRVDEAFPGGCGGGPVTPFIGNNSAARTFGTSRYRATLVVGQPALGAGRTARYRALVGNNPGLAPRPTPEAP